MSLKAKLARLSGVVGPAYPAPTSFAADDADHSEASKMPGRIESDPLGQLRVITHEYHCGDTYGSESLATVPGSFGASLAELACNDELNECLPKDALFIDTETTGLAGGAGTIPFLVGMSWYDGAKFVIEQAFVLGLGQEVPMLDRLEFRLRQASCIVTFNGKSFDWPLLRNRFVMNRRRPPEAPPHFDLLHAMRRIVKRRLHSCRLVNLEECLLATWREDDIEGADIPDAYFSYLETGRPGLIPKVIEHNRLDLLALPALLGWLLKRWTVPTVSRSGDDVLGFARLADRHGLHGRALEYAEHALQIGSTDVQAEAHLDLAKWARREGAYDVERTHLMQVIQLDHGHLREQAHLRLAITLEHSYKDPSGAYVHASQIGSAESVVDQNRRLRRLARRINRLSSDKGCVPCSTSSYT